MRPANDTKKHRVLKFESNGFRDSSRTPTAKRKSNTLRQQRKLKFSDPASFQGPQLFSKNTRKAR